ncbi:hypothetical protein [Streptomyces muensis]|uniref:Uncharacterized protein n=1 Tax=Streptomyces muensis TaxID=1077944 RepID=A0A9X1PXH9_STRM4|nr:hypothetical protein [Streptomyces muensis]MCF1594826.1 hypothetical protein [Streptomyces muensis]
MELAPALTVRGSRPVVLVASAAATRKVSAAALPAPFSSGEDEEEQAES